MPALASISRERGPRFLRGPVTLCSTGPEARAQFRRREAWPVVALDRPEARRLGFPFRPRLAHLLARAPHEVPPQQHVLAQRLAAQQESMGGCVVRELQGLAAAPQVIEGAGAHGRT